MDTPKEKTYYEILEIQQGADQSAIEAAYKRLAFRWHPDKAQQKGGKEQAAYQEHLEQFQRITHAHDILKDPELRKAYDSGLQAVFNEEQFLQTLNLNKNASYLEVKTAYKTWEAEKKAIPGTQSERLSMQIAWHAYTDTHSLKILDLIGCKSATPAIEIHLRYQVWKKQIAKNPGILSPSEKQSVYKEYEEFEKNQPFALTVLGLSPNASKMEFDTAYENWKQIKSGEPGKLPASMESRNLVNKAELLDLEKAINRDLSIWKPKTETSFKQQFQDLQEDSQQITRSFGPR